MSAVDTLVERLRRDAKSGTGAALDWTDEERADYWSSIAIRLRWLCREAADDLEAYEAKIAALTAERDALREKVERARERALDQLYTEASAIRFSRQPVLDGRGEMWAMVTECWLEDHGAMHSSARAALRQEGKP